MRRALAITAALAAALPAAATAAAPRQSFSGAFTNPAPGSSSGYRLAIDYRDPANPQGKPYAVQRVVQLLNAGTRLDTTAAPRCAASDAAFASQGEAACPPNTRVGGGAIDVESGQDAGRVPRVIKTRVVLFNADRVLIMFIESTNAGDPPIRTTARTAVGERTFTSEAPPIPGFPSPDPYLAIKRVRLAVRAVTAGGRALIRTPRTCPPSGEWTNAGTFTYRDGVSQTVRSRSRCSSPGARARRRDRWRPRIRVRGMPRRCRRRAFRVQIRIGEHNPLRRARARVDRRRARSTRRKRFRVRIPANRLRPGRHRLGVVAVDQAGNRARKVFRFRRC